MSQFVIYAHSGEYDRLYQVATMAVSAAANGDEAHVILFFHALKRFVDDDLEGVFAPSSPEGSATPGKEGVRGAKPSSISELIDSARQLGKLRLYACAAQPRLMGLASEDLADIVDEIISLPDFMRKTEGAKTKLFI